MQLQVIKIQDRRVTRIKTILKKKTFVIPEGAVSGARKEGILRLTVIGKQVSARRGKIQARGHHQLVAKSISGGGFD